ncbi:uncharacterized protein LOC119446643 isoform X1 [Dermacentor silvarum]|uniref:uncharacterized protein LOC119446643 isoform X1 n=1 Tax=Dermacentor silvarum TaxID=543639 RepID=UPI001897619C|nr:uncharacterized protein LOC119446643 isoform X1 [Dermacentor silvarum]
MVSALALFSAVALLSGACSAAPTDEASAAPAQGPGGLARRFEQIEQACFQEAQFTAEETSTVVDVRKRATEEVGSHNVNQQLDFLEYIDRYAPTPEIARGIRSKWNAFTVCVGREAAKLASSRP